MKNPLAKALAVGWMLGPVAGLTQGFPGATYGSAGPGGGGYGAVTVARVNVAPIAGGAGAGSAGVAGVAGAPPANGGLFGVTRPTYMAEANAVAAGFFLSAGVPLTPPAAANLVGPPRAAPSWGMRSRPANSGQRIARAQAAPVTPAVPKAAPPEAPVETPPFAPPVQLARAPAEPAGLSPGSSSGR